MSYLPWYIIATRVAYKSRREAFQEIEERAFTAAQGCILAQNSFARPFDNLRLALHAHMTDLIMVGFDGQ